MKKNIILVSYMIFISIFNIIFLNINFKFIDTCNLMFYNYKSFFNYELNTFTPQYLISFYLFSVFILNIINSDMNDNSSFYDMIVYRIGKKNTIKRLLKNTLIKILKIYFLVIIYIVILNIFMNNIEFTQKILLDFISFSVFLIKYFSIVFLLTLKSSFDIVNGEFSKGFAKLNISIFIFIFIDIILQTNLITFSGDLTTEFIYLTLCIVLINIYYYFKVIRGGKND